MNKTILALCGLALALPFGVASAADPVVIVPGGTILFQGRVVDAACAVDAASSDLTVVMGQVRVAALNKGVGTQSAARIPFNIVLDDCNTEVSENAAISFSGVNDGTAELVGVGPELISKSVVAGIGGDSSNGVGLQIFDKTGNPMTLDGVTLSDTEVLIAGQNKLKFQVGFVSLAPIGGIVAGDASANVDFKVNYF